MRLNCFFTFSLPFPPFIPLFSLALYYNPYLFGFPLPQFFKLENPLYNIARVEKLAEEGQMRSIV
jgi:hypothetical protein